MKKSVVVFCFSTMVAGIVALLVWLKPAEEAASTQLNTAVKPNNDEATTSQNISEPTPKSMPQQKPQPNQAVKPFKTGLEDLPRSLQGTQVDGEIIIDENKQLVVTRGLRRLFDYFLTTMGEEDEATINARVEAYITSRTPEPAASQAVGIYKNYIAYLKALTGLEKNYGHVQMQATKEGKLDLGLIKQRRNDNNSLRKQYFDDATISAFFGDDDAYEDYSVAMMELQKQGDLSPEQIQAAKEDYISKMPDSQQKENMLAYNKQQQNLATLMQKTEEMKKAGASAQELYQMRSALVGEAAAKRLAKVDEEDADFDKRFQTYLEQKQAILPQQGETSQAKQAIAKAASELFSETEAKRLDAYEQLHYKK